MNAAPIHIQCTGSHIRLIHIPTISSITTLEGSSPHIGCSLQAPTAPRTKKSNIKIPRKRKGAGEKSNRGTAGIKANSAPIVPGATFRYPTPNPVTRNFQPLNLLLFIIVKAQVCDQIFSFKMPKGVFELHQLAE